MTSQFTSIIEKIKTDKNVQVAVASIAAATVLVTSGTVYYISRGDSQSDVQSYKKASSIGVERYEKVRKDNSSDSKIDDKLFESISSATSGTSSTSNSSTTNTSGEERATSGASRQTQSSSDSNSSTVVQTVSNENRQNSEDQPSVNSVSEDKEKPSKKEDSNQKTSESMQSRKPFRSRRSLDQSDWNNGQKETKKSDTVSGDSWNDEEVVEELSVSR